MGLHVPTWLRCLWVRSAAPAVTVQEPEEPSPVIESPPAARFCDLVLTGGIASGVAYPWAIVELARHYRFRNLGGTSVGAVAAALTAASEYGRCMNVPNPFEALRRVPLDLAEPPEQACSGPRVAVPKAGPLRPPTKMISLFQPTAQGQRLFGLCVDALTLASRWVDRERLSNAGAPKEVVSDETYLRQAGIEPTTVCDWWRFGFRAVRVYAWASLREAMSIPALAVLLLLMAALLACPLWPVRLLAPMLAVGAVVYWGRAMVRLVLKDVVSGVVKNGFGFCSGMGSPGLDGFTEWMHKGIQKAAGLAVSASPPLTFRDLWEAPRPVSVIPAGADRCRPEHRAINLEVVVTNVTHGRPLRFPITDTTSRLYYNPEEWRGLFPESVLTWLEAHSQPYAPASPSDPEAGSPCNAKGLRTLPVEDLPIVVAARMSMSFPGLFSTIPVYAVDYESSREQQRYLRRCRIADGGLCSNFPIHFFDKALPRWPTFGLWLSQRLRSHRDQAVWLPKTHLQGRADNWLRFEPSTTEANPEDADEGKLSFTSVLRYLLALVTTTKDWSDRSTMLQPHVRNRVIRLALRPGEGQLHIAMPRSIILRMADQYGTMAGKRLSRAYLARGRGHAVSRQWREHLYLRTQVLLTGLRQLLGGLGAAMAERRYTEPASDVLSKAVLKPPLRSSGSRSQEQSPIAGRLTKPQAEQLQDCMHSLSLLEVQLAQAMQGQPYRPQPTPELRLRPPV